MSSNSAHPPTTTAPATPTAQWRDYFFRCLDHLIQTTADERIRLQATLGGLRALAQIDAISQRNLRLAQHQEALDLARAHHQRMCERDAQRGHLDAAAMSTASPSATASGHGGADDPVAAHPAPSPPHQHPIEDPEVPTSHAADTDQHAPSPLAPLRAILHLDQRHSPPQAAAAQSAAACVRDGSLQQCSDRDGQSSLRHMTDGQPPQAVAIHALDLELVQDCAGSARGLVQPRTARRAEDRHGFLELTSRLNSRQSTRAGSRRFAARSPPRID